MGELDEAQAEADWPERIWSYREQTRGGGSHMRLWVRSTWVWRISYAVVCAIDVRLCDCAICDRRAIDVQSMCGRYTQLACSRSRLHCDVHCDPGSQSRQLNSRQLHTQEGPRLELTAHHKHSLTAQRHSMPFSAAEDREFGP